ncbi:MAG: PASTA domain-containing protein [Fidelibacterota bacterium]
MRTLSYYFLTIVLLGALGLVVMDYIIMPVYTRQQQSRYLLDVRGRDYNLALARLESEGFQGFISDTLYNSDKPAGTVVDQYPKPNTLVKPGRTVHLKIAQPEKMRVVPNLIGQSLRNAELVLHQLGLLIDTVYTEFNPEYPEGTIAWQYPKAGDHLRKGIGIQITLSKGLPPDFYQVPNVIGLSLKNATELIEKARLKVGKISYHQDEDLVPYTVLDQSLTEGTVLDRSMPIDLVVSVLDMQDIFNRLTDEP